MERLEEIRVALHNPRVACLVIGDGLFLVSEVDRLSAQLDRALSAIDEECGFHRLGNENDSLKATLAAKDEALIRLSMMLPDPLNDQLWTQTQAESLRSIVMNALYTSTPGKLA